jgi:hypothetical protein
MFRILLLLFSWKFLHFHLLLRAFKGSNTDAILYFFSTDLFSCESCASALREECKFQLSEYKNLNHISDIQHHKLFQPITKQENNKQKNHHH